MNSTQNRLTDSIGWLVALAALLSAFTAGAALWYVDSSAGGSNTGTSWADAWTSLSSVSAISAGDTVYISGGPSGSSLNYSTGGTFPIKSGTSPSNRTSYLIGQDPQHNGTAIISGKITSGNYFTISGDAGDGLRHFQMSSTPYIAAGSGGTYVRLSYINFGTKSTGIYIVRPYHIEIDHCYLYKVQGEQDGVVTGWDYTGRTFTDYGEDKIHHNVFYAPRNGMGGGLGDDVITSLCASLDIYNNVIIGYHDPSYSASQHQDGYQSSWGKYLRVFNNVFIDIANAPIFPAAYSVSVSHVRIYNNIIMGSNSGITGSPMRGMDINAAGGNSPYSDVVVGNNLLVNLGSSARGAAFGIRMNGVSTYTDCIVANNIDIWGGGFVINGAVSSHNNYGELTWDSDTTHFINYIAFAGTNNDFHLTAGSQFRDAGTNLTAYGITTDIEGNPRPSTGVWDVGPYVYAGASTNPPVITVDPSDTTHSAGELASFAATVTGTAPLAYEWFTNGVSDGNAADSSTYSLTVAADSATNYYFIVTNSVGSDTSTVATLTIDTSPVINATPATIDFGLAVEGGSNTSTITVWNSGDSALAGTGTVSAPFYIISNATYNLATGTTNVMGVSFFPNQPGAWTNQSLSLTGGDGFLVALSGQSPPIVTSPWSATNGIINGLTISNNAFYITSQNLLVFDDFNATYYFQVNTAGVYRINAEINAPSGAENSLFILVDAVPAGDSNVFDVTPFGIGWSNYVVGARGVGGAASPEFETNLVSLSEGVHSLNVVGREANTYVRTWTASLIQTNVAPLDPPEILIYSQNAETNELGSTAFWLSVTTTDITNAVWYYEGAPQSLPDAVSGQSLIGSYLSVTNFQTNHVGDYYCVVENNELFATSVVFSAYSISTFVPDSMPTNVLQAAYNGAAVSIGPVTATGGVSPYTYQWLYYDIGASTEAPGQTNSTLTISNTRDITERYYRCQITDSVGETEWTSPVWIDTWNETLNVQTIRIGN